MAPSGISALVHRATLQMDRHVAPTLPHAFVSDIEEASIAWTMRLGLIDSDAAAAGLRKIHCGFLASLVLPRACREYIEIITDFFAWLFLFDDEYGEGSGSELRALACSLEHTLRTGALPAHAGPYYRALADLHGRLAEQCSQAQLDRFASSLRGYIEGCLLEIPYRNASRVPSLAEYRATRLYASAMFTGFALTEISLGELLTPEMHARPLLGQLRMLAASVCCWDNDIVSFEKEYRDGDGMNLISVLQQERKLSLEGAIGAAVGMFERDLYSFSALNEHVQHEPVLSSLERQYVQGLRDWIDGNRAWSQWTHRYQRPQS